jgi:hypothetical protein
VGLSLGKISRFDISLNNNVGLINYHREVNWTSILAIVLRTLPNEIIKGISTNYNW